MALAMALKIPSEELRILADIPAEGHPWMPPMESRLMSDRQRRLRAVNCGYTVELRGFEPRSKSLFMQVKIRSASVSEGLRRFHDLRICAQVLTVSMGRARRAS